MPASVASPGRAVPDHAEEVSEAALLLFRSLADPTRMAILRHLALGEHRVVDLTAHLGLAQSTVSAHLACLRGCGLVASRPVGRASVFVLTVPEELARLLVAAEGLLAATGGAVPPGTRLDAPATASQRSTPRERYPAPATGRPSRPPVEEKRSSVPLAGRPRPATSGQR